MPALGAALVTRDGGLDVDVVGVRIRGGDDPVTPDDPWHIGSCCKSVTAVLYARLVERGDAEWGIPLPALFPDLADTIDPGWAAVTIDDVFVSQAGLPANLGRAEMKAACGDAAPLERQRTAATTAALARPPRRPGRFLYSNLGYIVIGAAIERITGLPFESALALHVLEPLGITSAGFGPPRELWGHGGRMLALGPLGLVDIGRGAPADPERVESDNPAIMTPAGRLHLTLADWATVPARLPHERRRLPATRDGRATPHPRSRAGVSARARLGAGPRPRQRLLRPAGIEYLLGRDGPHRPGAGADRDGGVQRGAGAAPSADARARRPAPLGGLGAPSHYARTPPDWVSLASTSGPCSASRRSASAAASAWRSGPHGRLSCRHCSR